MAKLDTLIIKARKIRPDEFLSMGFLDEVEDHFELTAHLWNGRRFSGIAVLKSVHPTKEDALLRLDELEKQYPKKLNPAVVLMDTKEGGVDAWPDV